MIFEALSRLIGRGPQQQAVAALAAQAAVNRTGPLFRFVETVAGAKDLSRIDFFSAIDRAKRELSDQLTASTERLETLLLAMKLANLFVVQRDYDDRTIALSGRPLGFMLDPANGCNLGCPTCANTFNKEYAATALNPWPKGIMKSPVYDRIIEQVGPWAFVGHFYNNSEPYLNKNVHQFIKRASQLRVRTGTSSNVSIPKLDVEAIVESGLDELHIAIDGATQDVYQRYRRGGDIELAFENIARLVKAKKQMRSATPFIRWHYLTFEHNIHQVEMARAKARKLGVNYFFIVTPIDVSADDPSIKVATHPKAWQGEFLTDKVDWSMYTDVTPAEELIERSFGTSFVDEAAGESVAKGPENHCDWLYMSTVFDAMGRTFPCCIGDTVNHPTFQFGAIGRGNTTVMNSPEYLAARSFVAGAEKPAGTPRVRCETCRGRPVPQSGLNAVRDYLQKLAPVHPWLDAETVTQLAGWSRHHV
jgi:hypothetical protein